jgi:nitroreductase
MTDQPTPIRKPRVDAAIELLLSRRSLKTQRMSAPGPTPDELDVILRCATRVPDHAKLTPWRILVLQGEAQARVGKAWAEIYAAEHPNASPELLAVEAKRPAEAPLLLVVHTHITSTDRIRYEEQVSSGVNVCMNAIIAANALGYFTNWLTDWPCYHDAAKAVLGIRPQDHVLGMIYVGSGLEVPSDRPRPELHDVVRVL